MKLQSTLVPLGLILSAAIIVPAISVASPKSAPKKAAGLTFKKDIAGLVKAKCAGCHAGGAKAPEGLDLTSYALMMKGAKRGKKVVIPGHPEKSQFFTVLKGKPVQMPPDKKLDAKDIAKIEKWIKEGAKEK